MMDKKYNQQSLSQHIKTVLDRSVDELDADTRLQIQRMRANVLDAKSSKGFLTKWPVFGGIATFASISVMAILLLINKPQLPSDENYLLELDAVFFEVDSSIELYEQYEFYVWLSQQEFKS